MCRQNTFSVMDKKIMLSRLRRIIIYELPTGDTMGEFIQRYLGFYYKYVYYINEGAVDNRHKHTNFRVGVYIIHTTYEN